MSIKHSVFCKRYNSALYHTNMSLTLENLQAFVGGYIELIPVGDYEDQHVVMICNEEGKLRGEIAPNFAWRNGREVLDVVFGDVVFCAQEGDELVGVFGRLKHFRRWLNERGLIV